MIAERRPANLTDALRMLGALCVVWYHNPLYWGLQDYLPMVDTAKLVLLGWSMPFFYATSARFAFQGRDQHARLARMGRLLVLMLFYTALYELLRWNSDSGLAAHCWREAGQCQPGFVFDTVRNVDNTPGYYLSDLLSLYLLAAVAGLHPRAGWVIAVLAWGALLAGQVRLGGFFLNPLALGCLCMALAYRLLLAPRLALMQRIRLAPLAALALLLVLPLAWGVANAWLAQNDYWKNAAQIALFGLLLLVFLGIDQLVQCPQGLLGRLSSWGRDYAFGIFIFHQLCYDLLASRVVGWSQRLLHTGDALSLYLVAGLVATLAAAALTGIVRKLAPPLLAP